jgi:hypothetical protein
VTSVVIRWGRREGSRRDEVGPPREGQREDGAEHQHRSRREAVDRGPKIGLPTGTVPSNDMNHRGEDRRVINLQRVPEPKLGKNRLHFDVFVDEPDQWIDRAVSLGAAKVRLHDSQDDWFCVMHGPEGNEFCICLENAPG